MKMNQEERNVRLAPGWLFFCTLVVFSACGGAVIFEPEELPPPPPPVDSIVDIIVQPLIGQYALDSLLIVKDDHVWIVDTISGAYLFQLGERDGLEGAVTTAGSAHGIHHYINDSLQAGAGFSGFRTDLSGRYRLYPNYTNSPDSTFSVQFGTYNNREWFDLYTWSEYQNGVLVGTLRDATDRGYTTFYVRFTLIQEK